MALTAIDCLGYLDEIKVCTGYEIDGKVTTDFPVPALLDRAKPVYETLPGWKCDIRGVTDYGKLPQAARDYVDFIEKHIEAPSPWSPPAPSAMRSAGGPGAETVPLCAKAKESLRLCRRLSLCTPAQRLWR